MEDNLVPVNTIEELDKVITTQKQAVSMTKYIMLSLVMPPFTTVAAFYFAWKKGAFYELAPILTIIYTVLFALYSFVFLSSPKAIVDVMGKNLASQPQVDMVQNTILVVLSIVLTVVGIVGGFYLRKKANKQGGLSRGLIAFLIIILAWQFLVEIWQFSFITSIVSKSVGNSTLGL